jgi:voltage-gated potassium channel Kch
VRRLSWLQALMLLGLMSTGFVVLGALLVTRTDPERYPSVGTGLWWAVTTVTTVGYGDVVPATVAGRLVAAGLMFVGIASFALLTAVVASAIVVSDVGEEERENKREEGLILEQLRQLNERLTRLRVRADLSRRLRVIDPSGRSLHISCGAALFNLRIAVRYHGWHCRVLLLPDRSAPERLADALTQLPPA